MKICVILVWFLFFTIPVFANESGKEYKLYQYENFKVGDKVTYSFYWVCFNKTDFIGIVTKIEPKPTSEYIHWITVKRFSGNGEGGIYSEQYLEKLQEKIYE